ncbi:MAG TPA: c-type cytochrome [Gemmatimonadales bacterium]|nr:c-type cytochrome [Gemmatimonadales bacterium]
MPTIRCITMMLAVIVAAGACKGEGQQPKEQGVAAGVPSPDRIPVGGVQPPANALAAARPAKPDADAGATLFGTMNCDGCHGGGAVGWVGPSLVDGRWRYGGSDEEIFTSIVYGRPKGMPAYGGVIGTDGVWSLVAYIKSQAVPAVVPTTSWLPGGNASPTPAAAAAAAPAPAPAAEAKKSIAPEDMPAKYGCVACHAIDHKVIGPAFKDVAAKYRGQDAEEKLIDKVRLGGSGNWGQVPMVPNPQVPDADLHVLVKWILSLK